VAKSPLAKSLPKSAKRNAGATGASVTPLAIRTTGVDLPEGFRRWVRERAGRRLGKFAMHVERVTVRFEDLNGPRGGIDTECRIKIVISGLPSVIVEARAAGAPKAFDGAIGRATRVLRRHLEGRSSPRQGKIAREAKSSAEPVAKLASTKRTLIGRRVGRAAANLDDAAARPEKERGDALVDTAEPGTSATDRRAGGDNTARRNTNKGTSGATSALEDSLQARPSRKSTRRSKNRSKRDSNLRQRKVRAVRAPSARGRKQRTKKK
jgi:hypothetical protein